MVADTENPASASPTAETAAAVATPRSKRRRRRTAKAKRGAAPKIRRLMVQDDRLVDAKPSLPRLDPLEAAQEAARNAQEGNVKLAKAVDILRLGLETLVIAEFDNLTKLPLSVRDLRQLAADTLDAYSTHVGQDWRAKRNKLTGATLAGTKGNKPVHESQMGMPPEE